MRADDVVEDVWIAIAQNDEIRSELAISILPQKNPFILKCEAAIPNGGDWEKCSVVLDKDDEQQELMRGW
jgi:hypothetical protein